LQIAALTLTRLDRCSAHAYSYQHGALNTRSPISPKRDHHHRGTSSYQPHYVEPAVASPVVVSPTHTAPSCATGPKFCIFHDTSSAVVDMLRLHVRIRDTWYDPEKPKGLRSGLHHSKQPGSVQEVTIHHRSYATLNISRPCLLISMPRNERFIGRVMASSRAYLCHPRYQPRTANCLRLGHGTHFRGTNSPSTCNLLPELHYKRTRATRWIQSHVSHGSRKHRRHACKLSTA